MPPKSSRNVICAQQLTSHRILFDSPVSTTNEIPITCDLVLSTWDIEPMAHFFSRLPTELQTRVLQTIINTGASSLPPFLYAFPELATLVLLISDHVESETQVVNIPGSTLVDLEDHLLISQLRATRPTTVLSLIRCDEEAAFGRLTRNPDCPYGKYMDSESAVFVQLCGKALFGHQFLKNLMEVKGCSLSQVVIKHHRDKVRSSHVEMVGGGARSPAVLTCRHTRYGPVISSVNEDPEFPRIVSVYLPLGNMHFSFLCWSNITDISIQCTWRLLETQRLPHLQRIRFSCPLADRCFDRKTISGVGCPCDFSLYGLGYAYRVKEIYYEFSASRTPIISSGPWTCSNIRKADQFSFVNLDWSEKDRSLSSSLCIHAQEAGNDYVEWSTCRDQRPLTFLKIFERVTFIGIPDKIITLSSLTNTKQLVWKRLMAEKPVVIVEPQFTLHCPSLETLELTTLLRRDDETGLMPLINAKCLHRMDLCAVHDSDIPWDLRFHFTEQTLKSVKVLSMTAKHTEASEALSLSSGDLAPVSYTLESLAVTGYDPSFVNHGVDTCFPNLRELRLDMSYLPLETLVGQPCPLATVVLESDRFPALQSLALDISARERSPLLYNGMCWIKVQVPACCRSLTVVERITANRLFVVVEHEERCVGKTVTPLDFTRTPGQPGYVSLQL